MFLRSCGVFLPPTLTPLNVFACIDEVWLTVYPLPFGAFFILTLAFPEVPRDSAFSAAVNFVACLCAPALDEAVHFVVIGGRVPPPEMAFGAARATLLRIPIDLRCDAVNASRFADWCKSMAFDRSAPTGFRPAVPPDRTHAFASALVT